MGTIPRRAVTDGVLRTMRVVAGQFRGRSLDAPEGLTTRPMTDRAKETLFNILGSRCAKPGELPDFDVLDLFAGTGGLGIEAMSRGARSCIFVERDRQALRALRTNLGRLGLNGVCRILADNAWTMRPPTCAAGFGLIFADPPYRDATDPLRVLDFLERLSHCLAADGLIMLRLEAQVLPPAADELRGLRYLKERLLGRMRLIFLVRSPADPPPADADVPPPT